MLFPTATFAIFFLLVLPLSWLTMPRGARWRAFIIVASFVFYAGWDWRFCFLLAFSIGWNQVFANAIHARRVESQRKTLLGIALAGNLGLLGYFKYYDFFVTSTNNLFAVVGIDRVMRAARAEGADGVVWVTLREHGRYASLYRGTNLAIRKAAKRWPQLLVADWNAYSAGRPWFGSDGLHLSPRGAVELASFIRPYVFRAASPE